MKHSYKFILIMVLFAACSSSDQQEEPAIPKKPTAFQLAAVQKIPVGSSIKLPGQFAAYQQVSIFPKVNAYVKTVYADIGDKVKQGQLLMKLEAPELQQATLQAKEKYARAKADFSMDREHFQRLMEASNTPGAISALDLSTIRSKMDADSALGNAEKSNWQMQQEMQTYLTVTAPFNGVITERNVYPGALVNAVAKDKPMLELKEISRLRLQADIPEALASTLQVNDTISFYTSALPGKKISSNISRKSMNVNPQFRSERIEIDVNNKDAQLSPGMYADVIIYSKGNTSALSVPVSSVVTTTEKKFVWLAANGRARRIDVTTGNASGGKTEVYGNLREGQQVVTNPGDDLTDGQALQ
jgi:membrane fusion protein (multidrug efflux system)